MKTGKALTHFQELQTAGHDPLFPFFCHRRRPPDGCVYARIQSTNFFSFSSFFCNHTPKGATNDGTTLNLKQALVASFAKCILLAWPRFSLPQNYMSAGLYYITSVQQNVARNSLIVGVTHFSFFLSLILSWKWLTVLADLIWLRFNAQLDIGSRGFNK